MKRRSAILVFGLAGVALGVLVYLNWPVSYAEHARRLYAATVEGNDGVLLRYAHNAEIELNELDSRKVSQLRRRILNAPYEGWVPDGPIQWYSVNDFSGIASQQWRKGQATQKRGVQVIDWDGAPRRSLTDALAASWQILGRMKQASAGGGGRTAGLRGMCLACLDGYERDAAWLKEIGVRYFVFEDLSWGQLAVQRLDQLEAMWRAEVADPECIQDPAFFSRYQMTVEQARADKRRSRR